MLRTMTLAALSCAAAGSALAQTPSFSEQLAGGTWACSAISEGLNVLSKQSYKADGTSAITVLVFGNTQDVEVRIVAEGVGKWSFEGSDLNETLSTMTATHAAFNGEQQMQAAQDMLNSTMLNVILSNEASFEAGTLHLVDDEGVITDCVR